MPSLGSLWYQLGIKDLTDADLQKINAKLKNLGFDIQLTPKILKDLTQSAVPKGIKIELDPTIKNEALARAVEGKVMRIAVTPLLTGFREAIAKATRENPPQAEIGVSAERLRNLVTTVLNRQGFMINISTVNDNYSKAIQAKLNGTTYKVKIHADANEITRSVQTSLMQVQSRYFGLKVSRDILYRSIDEALGQKRFNINIAVSHGQARQAVQAALTRAQVMGKDQALAYQRLQTGEMKAAQAELMRLKAAHMGVADAAKVHATASIDLGGALGSNIKIAGELGSAMASMYSIHAAKEFLSQVIEIGGELEHQKIAMDTIFGDKGKTNELFGQIKGLARNSPFGVMELTSSVKRLSAYGVEYNEIYDTAKRLADISAATSVDINRLILAFGKTKSRGFLDGLEAKQFAYANIPIYEMVRKKLEELEGQAVTTADVMARMKKREIGFDIVKDVLWDITDEGGKFYNMQEALAGSVKTSWKLVRDNIELMFGEIAESAVGSTLKSTAEVLQGLTRNWRTVAAVVGTAAVGLGVYKVATLGVNSAVQKSTVATYNQIIAQKQKNAEELKAWGRITQLDRAEKMRIATANKLTNADLRRALTEGTLTDKHIAQLFWQKKLTAEQVKYLTSIGMLNPAMSKAILSNNRLTLSLQMMKQGLISAGLAVKSFLLNPWTIGIAAITAVVGLWQKHSEKIAKTEENIKQLGETAREGSKNLSAEVEKLNAMKPTAMSPTEFKNSIEEMKTVLKDYDPTWMDAFKAAFSPDDAGNVKSLAEQYGILKQAVIDTAAAYEELYRSKNIASDAHETTDGRFDDSLKENIKDYLDAKRDYEKILNELLVLPEAAKKAVNAAMDASPEYKAAVEGKSLAEQLAEINKYQQAWAAVFKVLNSANEEENKFRNTFISLNDFERNDLMPAFDSMQADDKIFGDNLKKMYEGLYGNIEQWSEPTKKAVIMGVRNIYESADGVAKEEADKLANQTLTTVFKFKITTDFELDESQLNDWQTELDNLTKGQFTTMIRMAPDYLTALKEIQEATDEAQKKLNDAKLKMPIDIQFNGNFGMTPNQVPGWSVMSASTQNAATSMLNWLKQLAGANAGGITPTPQKSNKQGKSGTPKDKFAESLKHRLDILKKAYAEYKKELAIMSKDAALARVKEAGIFDELFTGEDAITDFDSYEATLEKLLADAEASLKGLSEKDSRFKGRHDLVVSLRTLLNLEIPRDKAKEALDKAKREIDALVSETTKKWDFYKAIFAQTGDKEASMRIAFGENIAWTDATQQLQDELNNRLREKNLEVSLSLSYEEAKEKLKGTELYDLWKKVKDAIEKDGIDLRVDLAKAVYEASSIADKIKAQEGLRNAYETELRTKLPNITEIEVEAALKPYNDKIEELKSSMLELLPIWEQIFGDHQYQSYGQIQAAADIAKQIIDNAKIKKDANGKPVSFTSVYTDAEGNKQQIMGKISQLEKLRKAIQDLYKEGLKKNPFVTLWESLKKVFNGNWKDKNITEKLALIGESAAESAALVGNLAGQLANMFDAMGNDSMGQAMTDVQDVMNSVSNIGKGFAQGGLVGGIAAAAGEAIGWVTKLFKRHDAKLQKMIERSKQAAQIMQNQYDILEKRMANFLGNAAGMKMGVEGGAFGKQRELMQGQLTELEKQRRAELDKKDTDYSVVADYDKQIEEMKISIRDFAEEAANAVYGIDLNGWASQIGDALVDAFAKGEDAAEAFDKTVADIMRDITSKMIAQDILAPMFGDLRKFLFGENGLGGAFGKDFKLDPSETAAMKEYLDKIKNKGIPAAEELFDAINKATGGLLDDTDKAKSGLPAGIQAVTEDTADLLASYVNAIRASVAMNEGRWERLLNDSLPQMNIIAQSQLDAQRQIAENTLRNAIAAEAIVKSNDDISRLLARVTQGGAKFYIH